MPKGVPNKRYTGEFKQMVVETMMREKLSYREASRQFEIPDHKDVAKWERYYLMDGPEGLYIERRGRGSKDRPQQFPKEVEEDLLKEVQRLRAENLVQIKITFDHNHTSCLLRKCSNFQVKESQVFGEIKGKLGFIECSKHIILQSELCTAQPVHAPLKSDYFSQISYFLRDTSSGSIGSE